MFCFFIHIIMSCYWFNRQELLQMQKIDINGGGKEKSTEYYIANQKS